jgi:guanine deaminase
VEPKDFALKGDICYSKSPTQIFTAADAYLVCVQGRSAGVFAAIPPEYRQLPLIDHSGKLIMPGLCDLHTHAPQYSFRALGMDLELLDWLNTHAFPEEAKYADLAYAEKAYRALVRDLQKGPNTRICFFATIHADATILLMDLLEQSGLVSMVGKVNMDRNTPGSLCEKSAEASADATRKWLLQCMQNSGAYKNTRPILTPRFIPSCSDELFVLLSG